MSNCYNHLLQCTFSHSDMLNSSHLLICSLTFTNSFIQAYCIMFELRSCVVTWLSSWHIRITSIAFFRRTLRSTSHIENIFRVTWLTNTADADPKFVRKRVWGRKEGIKAKKKIESFACLFRQTLFIRLPPSLVPSVRRKKARWSECSELGKLRIFISYGTCF